MRRSRTPVLSMILGADQSGNSSARASLVSTRSGNWLAIAVILPVAITKPAAPPHADPG